MLCSVRKSEERYAIENPPDEGDRMKIFLLLTDLCGFGKYDSGSEDETDIPGPRKHGTGPGDGITA